MRVCSDKLELNSTVSQQQLEFHTFSAPGIGRRIPPAYTSPIHSFLVACHVAALKLVAFATRRYLPSRVHSISGSPLKTPSSASLVSLGHFPTLFFIYCVSFIINFGGFHCAMMCGVANSCQNKIFVCRVFSAAPLNEILVASCIEANKYLVV